MEKYSYKTLLTIVVFLLIGIVSLLRLQQKPSLVSAQWWSDSWNYRQSINITSHSSTETNVYIIATINVGNTTKAQSDDGDFRFIDNSGNLLDYYISANTGTTAPTFHIQIPTFSSGAQTIYAYYGNATATNGFQNSDFSTQATSYTIGSYGTEEKGGGPVAYWKFNEGVGTTIYDSSANNKFGVFGSGTSAPNWISDKQCISDKCISFDGSNDKLTIGSTIGSIYSVSFWIWTGNTAPAIIDFDGGTHYISGSGGTFSATGFSSPTIYVNGQTSTSFSTNQWSLVTVSTGTSFSGTAINMGKISTNFFSGRLDDFKIYNYTLSATQVKQQLTSVGSGLSATNLGPSISLTNGLLGWWKMDENVGTTSVDSIGTTNLITFGSGTSAPSWSPGKYGVGISFDGSNDKATLFSSVSNLQTVSFWFYPTSTSPAVIDFDGGTHYISGSSGTLTATGFVDPLIYINGLLTSSFSINTWSHVTIVTNTPFTATAVTLGKVSTNFFPGIIDEFRLYNRSFSPSEINQLSQWAPSPVAYWNFEEISGSTAFDTSGNSNNGTITAGNGQYLPGKFGGGYNFDGATSQINAASDTVLDNLPTTAGISLSTWINPKNEGENNAGFIVAKNVGTAANSGWILQLTPTNAINFTVDGSTDLVRTTANNIISPSSWNHIELTWDGIITTASTVKIYVNGIEVGYSTTTNGASRVSDTSSNLYIGNDSTQARTFNGIIDDLKIYNYVRTPSQIIEDMYAGYQLSSNNPVVYYKFDEGYGTTTRNSSSIGSTFNGSLATGNSSPTWSNFGQYGRALSFDGTNDYLSVGNTTSIYSVSLWYFTSTSAPSFFDFSTTSNIGSTGSIFYSTGITTPTYYVDGLATSNIGTTNTWHHFTLITTSPITANSLKIGKSGTRYHSGLLDEVKVYSYPLTSHEVLVDFNQSSNIIFGSLGNQVGNTSPNNSSSQQYCIPGDTSICSPPIGEWLFEQNTGTTAYDSSGNNYHAVFASGSSAPDWISGKIGSGLNFNGVTDYTDTGDVFYSDILTIEAWVNIHSVNGSVYKSIIEKRNSSGVTAGSNEFEIVIRPNRQIEWGTWDSGGAGITNTRSTTTLNLNQWYHVAITHSGIGGTAFVYVNGIKESAEGIDATIRDGTSHLQFSPRHASDNNRFYDGLLDDVRIFDYVRTPAQIAYDYNHGAPIAWYKFDECQGNVANNSANIGYSGTITIGASGTQNSLGTCSLGTSATWTNGASGNINSSLNFDGTDDVVTIGGTIPQVNTVSFWAKPSSSTTNILQLNSSTNITATAGTLSASGFTNPSFYINGIGSSAIIANTWQQITISTGTTINANQIKIGLVNSSYYSGQLDDVRIYNYPLTTTQIKTIYNLNSVNFK
ncbi:DUF2341 domain-containing protein [Candidatus Shapirobacteria bacterium]|nr:DUF2341 domain-containing protein [Candidatus Shapirobacteria bacterium]